MSKANCCSVGFVRSKVWSYPQVSRPTAFPLPVCHTGQQVFFWVALAPFSKRTMPRSSRRFSALDTLPASRCTISASAAMLSGLCVLIASSSILFSPFKASAKARSVGKKILDASGSGLISPRAIFMVYSRISAGLIMPTFTTRVFICHVSFSQALHLNAPPPLMLAQLAAELQKLAENTVAHYEVLAQLT